jgi:hypothetical protein
VKIYFGYKKLKRIPNLLLKKIMYLLYVSQQNEPEQLISPYVFDTFFLSLLVTKISSQTSILNITIFILTDLCLQEHLVKITPQPK